MEGNPQAGRLTSYLAYLASGEKWVSKVGAKLSISWAPNLVNL